MTIHIPTALAVFLILFAIGASILFLAYFLMLEWHLTRRRVPHYDDLTGLYSRGTIKLHIAHYLNRIRHTTSSPPSDNSVQDAFLLLDLDGFKSVNDTYGHPSGDRLLAGIAKLLLDHTRHCDLVGRIGGDEFLLYLTRVHTREDVLKKTKMLVTLIQESTADNPRWAAVTASIGIALVPQHGYTFEELYCKADDALYQAKKNGKNQCVIYGDS